jgi:hypothetical protein
MSTLFAESESLLVGNYSQPFGLGFECELVQRAAKAQILRYLPGLTSQLQNIWDERDKEFIGVMGGSYKRIRIPKVEKENILSGIEVISLIEAPIDRWPAILIYARNGSAYQIQEDQFDMLSVSLNIEVLCNIGPVNSEEVHGKEGLIAMQELDSQIQRLSDAVYLCIQKDKTLSGSVGQIEKPPKSITSAPWARKKEKTATGESYIFQGKQFDFTVQKISI